MASFFFVVEFKCIKKIIHMSTCIRKYFYLILNSTTKKKIASKKTLNPIISENLIKFTYQSISLEKKIECYNFILNRYSNQKFSKFKYFPFPGKRKIFLN